jgi:hypothetical protein
MAVLALDLATKTGWALHKPGMERPFFGTLTLPLGTDRLGLCVDRLDEFLFDQHVMHGLTDIAFEAQHIAGTKIDMNVVYKLCGLGMHVEWFCYRIGITDRCFKVSIGTWRKHFIGDGRVARGEAKIKAIDECRRLGLNPPDDNAAEAFGILDYYLSLKRSYERPWRDAAFMKRLGTL